jgi:hypothetical protein
LVKTLAAMSVGTLWVRGTSGWFLSPHLAEMTGLQE